MVARNDGAAPRNGVKEDERAARNVIEEETILFRKPNETGERQSAACDPMRKLPEKNVKNASWY